jgi:hypothetical protein
MQIQTDSSCGLISKGRLSDFNTLRMRPSYNPLLASGKRGKRRALGRKLLPLQE